MRFSRRFALPLVVLAATFSLLGCGSGDERELDGEPFTDQELTDWTGALDDIQQRGNDGDCEGADSRLATLRDAVGKSASDEGLKTDLISLLDDLDAQLDEQCTDEPEETTTSTTTDDEETATSTTTTSTTTTQETTAPEESVETTTTTVPEEPSNEPPVTPPGQGGVPPGQEGGISPGSFEPERKATDSP